MNNSSYSLLKNLISISPQKLTFIYDTTSANWVQRDKIKFLTHGELPIAPEFFLNSRFSNYTYSEE